MSTFSFDSSIWRVSRGSIASRLSIITFVVASAASREQLRQIASVASKAISAVPTSSRKLFGHMATMTKSDDE